MASINTSSAIYLTLSHIVTDLEPVLAPKVSIPLVASAGSITNVLLKKKSWLSSPAAATLIPHFEKGDLVLAVNAYNHDQFVQAVHLLLRHSDGNVLSHIFHWPSNAAQE